MPSPGAAREAFDAAYAEMERTRGRTPSVDSMSLQMRDVAFHTFYDAAARSCCAIVSERHPDAEWSQNNPLPWPPTMHVLDAAPGAGKSTLAKAFMVGLLRANEADDARWPLGAVLLVHHVGTAQRAFDELNALLPGRVAVFSREHDKARPTSSRTDRFFIEELSGFPLLVVTHEFYKGVRGDAARSYTCGGVTFPRVVTFIDEKVNEVELYDVQQSDIVSALEFVQHDRERHPMALPAMLALYGFTSPKVLGERHLETPEHSDDWKLADEIEWFATEAAGHYVRSRSAWKGSTATLEAVFGFGAALVDRRAFVVRQNKGENGTRFVGYESALPQLPGMVLLDATADIDGVSKLCPWREHATTPMARYDRLEVIHVPSVVKGTTRRWLNKPQNMKLYVQHIKDTVLRHVAVGQKVLVVCMKQIAHARQLSGWSEHMSAFVDDSLKDFVWNLEGRKVAVAWWGGYGVGANDYREADVVILFEDFHLPRHAVIATVQGLKDHTANQGALAKLAATQVKKHHDVDAIAIGHVHRWLKQMALRGKAREFDREGMCGKQKLVIVSSDLARLTAQIHELFPGANFSSEAPKDQKTRRVDQVLHLLVNTIENEITTIEVGNALGFAWRKVSKDVLKHPTWPKALAAIGWRYEPQGRGVPAVFKRL